MHFRRLSVKSAFCAIDAAVHDFILGDVYKFSDYNYYCYYYYTYMQHSKNSAKLLLRFY